MRNCSPSVNSLLAYFCANAPPLSSNAAYVWLSYPKPPSPRLNPLTALPIPVIQQEKLAGWRSGNATVCKTVMRGFESRSGLQLYSPTPTGFAPRGGLLILVIWRHARVRAEDRRLWRQSRSGLQLYSPPPTGFAPRGDLLFLININAHRREN